ncbi:hypothetical protein GYMLUDRAFT_247010 [Collybiopsis luxurians FD-317 M1]|uniref:Uncharacterized protein n=1 Tax=Collybiopsis luxurians FD-317 M1 TaxID=944289 RepID=A0A0D0BQG6_9AGAR|nr:hypothetical protein GYMLUDRAFT_247010 [Collybiopsis luxurians FD-317 M1]
MTPEDQQTIVIYAAAINTNTISFILVETVGFGASVLGMLIACHIIVTKSLTHSRIALLACLIITFIALTWSMLCEGAFTLIEVQVLLMQIKPDIQGGLEAEAQISIKKSLPFQSMQTWPFAISIILSDLIVVWRAWSLFQQERLWKAALTLLMIIDVGIQIADCILDNIDIKVLELASSVILDWLSLVVSLVVNMFATALIAWKAW